MPNRIVWILGVISVVLFAKEVRIATYNVENLFDARFQGSEYDAYIPGKHGWNRTLAQRKLERTAEVICDIDADVIALQEIENKSVFQSLQRLLKKVGCPYRYGVITSKPSAPIQIALLSKMRILSSKELVVSPAPKVRNILEVRIQTPIEPIRVFVNHWKSRSRDGWESKRIRYAKTLAKRLDQLNAQEPIVLLGDFNTEYSAFETLEKKIDDTGGVSGLYGFLPTLHPSKKLPYRKNQMAHMKTLAFYDLWFELPVSKRWSQRFFGKKGSADHILLSNAFFDQKGIEYHDGSFRVFKRPYLLNRYGAPLRWGFQNGKHRARGYSDHLPLVAVLSDEPFYMRHKGYAPATAIETNIRSLYDKPVDKSGRYLLRNVAVVLKRKGHGVIKGFGGDRGLFVYGSAHLLREGVCYDLIVEGLQYYKGLLEATGVRVVKRHEHCDVLRLVHEGLGYLRADPKQNEVIGKIEGVYQKGRLHFSGGSIPIYFRKGVNKPPQGSRIKIDYAHIGYYKRLQLVIYSNDDFEVL